MNYIIVGKHGRPSIRAVSAQLKEPHICFMRKKYLNGNIRWFFLHHDKWIKTKKGFVPRFREKDKVIRWGISCTIIGKPTVYQEAKAIDIISNKGLSRTMMLDNGVPCPKTSTYNNQIDVGIPYIYRPLRHSRGRDFYIISNLKEEMDLVKKGFNKLNGYISAIYDKTEEVRVYVAHRKVLMIREKPLIKGVLQANRAITHDEWRIVPLSEYSRFYGACRAAIEACDAVGAHIGGVDVMINRKNKEMPVCVCEINSAPTIKSSEYGVQRFAEYFDWLFKSKRSTWKYIDPKTGDKRNFPTLGKSFFFTHNQLEG